MSWTNYLTKMVQLRSITFNLLCRYIRNTIVHAQQHKKSLEQHYGSSDRAAILRALLASAPGALVHFYMFAKRELPALPCTEKISEKCLIAYDDLMRKEKWKIKSKSKSEGYQKIWPRRKTSCKYNDKHVPERHKL